MAAGCTFRTRRNRRKSAGADGRQPRRDAGSELAPGAAAAASMTRCNRSTPARGADRRGWPMPFGPRSHDLRAVARRRDRHAFRPALSDEPSGRRSAPARARSEHPRGSCAGPISAPRPPASRARRPWRTTLLWTYDGRKRATTGLKPISMAPESSSPRRSSISVQACPSPRGIDRS